LKRCAKVLKLVKGVIINGKANLFLIGNKELCLLKKKITSIYFESQNNVTGSPRMKVELASLGSKGLELQWLNIRINWVYGSKLSKKNSRLLTNSKHNHLIMPNVLNREFSVTEPSKFALDITYIQPKKRFLYLTTVLDPVIEKS
jgi:hypothetical protein